MRELTEETTKSPVNSVVGRPCFQYATPMAPCPGLIILLSILLALRTSCHDVPPTITTRARPPKELQARQNVGGFAGFLLTGGECK